ncbi:uncharacterized protein E0L32_004553 [Thyridium curvatum]|uniref:Uncharacterized protein n=1 Tax=Thyridium curvatum TaxID=1093900 RepID=A0A507B818_9PEZI|nr:uncharacterized protein E0L32_004553 [Thyridium curvatum]TPX15276.1 hypothetical protein E0L32_004553 [Thyridium curvatum]
MTNLGPLTTAFLPATDCDSVVHGYVHTETNPANASDSTTYKYHSLGLTTTSACFPPGFRPSADAFYSPGICPSDMVSACGSIEAIGTITETRATCCPRGYTCIAQAAAATPWSTLSCSSVAISTVTVTVPNVANQAEKVTVLDKPLIYAAAVNIRWQKADFETSGPILATPTSTAPLRGSTANPSAASGPDTGLSKGAKIGIGLGVAGGVVLLGAIIALLVMRARRRAERERLVPSQEPHQSPELDLTRHIVPGPQEMWNEPKIEMEASSNPTEVHGHTRAVELQGS